MEDMADSGNLLMDSGNSMTFATNNEAGATTAFQSQVGSEEKPEGGDIPTMTYEEAVKNIERRGSKIEPISDNEDKPVTSRANSGGQRKSIKLIKEKEESKEPMPVIGQVKVQQKEEAKKEKKASGGGVFGFFSKICGGSNKKAVEVEEKSEAMDKSARSEASSKVNTSLRIKKTSVKKPKDSKEEDRLKEMKASSESEIKKGKYLDK